MAMGVLVQAMLAIGPADPRLARTGMEALHGLEVLAVDVGLAEIQRPGGMQCGIQVAGVER